MPERAADNDSEAARAAMCANMEGRMMLWDGGGRPAETTIDSSGQLRRNAHCRLLRSAREQSESR